MEDGRFAVRLGFRMVKGLANKHGAAIVAAREDEPFQSIDDLWRRANAPSASLVQLAEDHGTAIGGDGFPLFESLGILLLLRAFSSGAVALTGIEAISNGVPAFKKPESHNAATTLITMGPIRSEAPV